MAYCAFYYGLANLGCPGMVTGGRAEVLIRTSSIPQGELDLLSINLNISNVVLEHCWDIDLCDIHVEMKK